MSESLGSLANPTNTTRFLASGTSGLAGCLECIEARLVAIESRLLNAERKSRILPELESRLLQLERKSHTVCDIDDVGSLKNGVEGVPGVKNEAGIPSGRKVESGNILQDQQRAAHLADEDQNELSGPTHLNGNNDLLNAIELRPAHVVDIDQNELSSPTHLNGNDDLLNAIELRLSDVETKCQTALATMRNDVSRCQSDIADMQILEARLSGEVFQASSKRRYQSPQSFTTVEREQHVQDVMSSEGQYDWHDTIWDASLFIGANHFSLKGSMSVALCLIIYVGLCLAFVTESEMRLTTASFDDSTRDEFTRWRTEAAHDVAFRNKISGDSLVSMVCNQKAFVPFSTLQYMANSELREYLHEQRLFLFDVVAGRWSCCLALFVWYLTLFREVRIVNDVWLAFRGVQTGDTMEFRPDPDDKDRVQLVSVTICRRAFIWCVLLLRTILVLAIGYIGTLYLVYETSLGDMLENAVVLSFIMDLDELMYDALLPKLPQIRLHAISPLQYKLPRCRFWHKSGQLIATGVCFSLIYLLVIYLLLGPFIEQLIDNLEALCGGVPGSFDFVMAVDSLGIPWLAPTTPDALGVWHETLAYPHSVLQQVKKSGWIESQELLTSDQRQNTGMWMQVSSAQSLEKFMLQSAFESPARWQAIDPECQIHEVIGWDEVQVLLNQDFGDQVGTVYNYFLQHLLGTSGNTSCAQVPMSRCFAYGSTRLDVVMRKLCPRRCGCATPTAGAVGNPLVRGENEAFGFIGCSSWNMHTKLLTENLAELPCVDTNSIDEFAVWSEGLIVAEMNAAVMDAFRSGGCPGVIDLYQRAGVGPRFNPCDITSLPAVCPESCACAAGGTWDTKQAARRAFCPYSCVGKALPCFTIHVNFSKATDYYHYGPLGGYACIFPFTYEGQTHYNCTSVGWTQPWCAVTISPNRAPVHWGACPASDCHNFSNQKFTLPDPE